MCGGLAEKKSVELGDSPRGGSSQRTAVSRHLYRWTNFPCSPCKEKSSLLLAMTMKFSYDYSLYFGIGEKLLVTIAVTTLQQILVGRNINLVIRSSIISQMVQRVSL